MSGAQEAGAAKPGCGCGGGCGCGCAGGKLAAVLGGASLILRLQLGAIFLFASWMKLHPKASAYQPSGPEDFIIAIQGFKLGLPAWLLRLTAASLPWVEAVSALCLVIGLFTRAAGLMLTLLLTLFTALVVSALLRELHIDCGCFGDRGLICAKAMGWCKVVENSFMLLAGVIITATPRHPASVDGLLARRG